MKVLIIGGGIIGASIAWRLAGEGAEVLVLERGRLGREASWAAAGLIGPQAEAQEPGIFFDLCMRAKQSFDACIDQLTDESGIDPEYDDNGVLYAAFDEPSVAALKRRAHWQRAAGATVEELTPHEVAKLAPALSPEVIYGLHLPTNRRLENRKLTQAYINAAILKGAEFRERARVAEIATSGGRASGLKLDGGESLTGDLIINCAGAWASQLRGLEHDRISFFPVRGQMLCFELRPGEIEPTLFALGGILVPRRDGRVLAGSVFEEAGFNRSVTLGAMERIVSAARTMVPRLESMPFREAWTGFRPATDDLLPVLGPSPSVSGVFYAAGHFRSGILLSALTGEVIADLAMGRKPSLDLTPFAPSRFLSGNVERAKLPGRA